MYNPSSRASASMILVILSSWGLDDECDGKKAAGMKGVATKFIWKPLRFKQTCHL